MITSTLVSLLYVSKIVDGMDDTGLAALERQASATNDHAGISGMLIFNGSNFVQLLEGEEAEVAATMERIEQDPRHTNIHILRRSGVRERECPDWGMRCHYVELTENGSATDFSATLPSSMLPDTRLIFTSLASAVGRDT